MPYRFGLYRPVSEERPFVQAHLVVRSRQTVGCYLRRLNAAPGTGLQPFGLPFACGPAPW